MRCLIKYQFISHTPPPHPHPSFSYPLYFISSLRIWSIYYRNASHRIFIIQMWIYEQVVYDAFVCPSVQHVCPSVWQRTNVLLLLSVRPSVHLSVDDGAWFIVDLLTIFIFFLAALSTEFCISLHGYCSHGCFVLLLYVYHHSRCWFWLAMWWYVWWCWSWWYFGSYCC